MQRYQTPRPEILLRQALLTDAHAIALMSRDFIESGFGWRYDPPRILRALKDPAVTTLVATDRGNIVGFAIMAFGEARAHLTLLAVRPSHRRLGVGRRLMGWLTESALIAGIESIHLELRVSNEAAHRFYAVLGYSDSYTVPGYYRGAERIEGALRMLRVLRQPEAPAYTWQPPRTEDT